MELIFQDWGLVPYQEALQRQLTLLEEVYQKKSPGYLIFCKHPPVVTLGRSARPEDVYAWPGEIVEVSRGGRATYHGPSQLVIYPIVNLIYERNGRKAREVAGYLRAFEQAIVEVLKAHGVSDVMGRSLQSNNLTEKTEPETGVWVGTRKVASLGIGVRKWVTYHGAAINLLDDPDAFLGMNPCGFKKEVMQNLECLLGKGFNVEVFEATLKKSLLSNL